MRCGNDLDLLRSAVTTYRWEGREGEEKEGPIDDDDERGSGDRSSSPGGF